MAELLIALSAAQIVILVGSTIVAFIGGLARELRDANGDFDKRHLASAFVSGFAGFVLSCLMLSWFPAQPLILLPAAGITGWSGPWILDLLTPLFQKIVESRLGVMLSLSKGAATEVTPAPKPEVPKATDSSDEIILLP